MADPKKKDKVGYSTPAANMRSGGDSKPFTPIPPQVVRRLTAAGKIRPPAPTTRKSAPPRPVMPQDIHRAGSKPSLVTGGYDAQRKQQALQNALIDRIVEQNSPPKKGK